MGRSERKRGIMPKQYVNPYASKRESGKYNRRGRRIGGPSTAVPAAVTSGNVINLGGKSYSEEEFKEKFGSLRELALSEQERLGREGKGADIRGGGGLKGDGTRFTEPTRNVLKHDGSQGTQTGPAQAKPADMGAFMNHLQSAYGIKFNYGEQDRNGYQSNALPGTAATRQFATDEFSADDARVMGMSAEDSATLANGGSIETVIGGSTAKGAQSGASDSADVGDQSRALEVDASAPQKLSGLSARSRAFLDYEGKGGAAMALRAAEAAQGTIKQNGVLYGMSKDGTATRISDEGADILRRDRNAIASQEFLKNYSYVPAGPAETEPADVMRPVDTSVSRGVYQSGYEVPTTDVGNNYDIGEAAKLQTDPANQPYNITEEIQMRSGKDVPYMRF